MILSARRAELGMMDGGRQRMSMIVNRRINNDIQEGWRATLCHHRASGPHPVVASALAAAHGRYANLGVDTSTSNW